MPPAPPSTALLRRLLLLPGVAAMWLALWGGLARLGVPLWAPSLAVVWHGPLFVSGLLGTLVSLERAVALGERWAFAGPLAGGAGTLLLALGGSPSAAAGLFAIAALALVAASLRIVGRQSAPFTWLMAVASALWLVGDIVWARGAPVFEVVPWWLAFLVLTVAAERLELSRLVRRPRGAQEVFLGLAGVAVLGLVLRRPVLWGAAFAGLASWLALFDVARRTLRQRGFPRFAALAFLAGYGWLALAGLLLVVSPFARSGPRYDAVLHAVFVGFVVSMVFAHAPVILPAVARVPLTYVPGFYVPLVALHASVLLRMVGDLLPSAGLRQAGGIGNALAILLYAVVALLRPAYQK